MSIKSAIWDVTTALVADSIALFNPEKGREYRQKREAYKRAYIATELKGPYQNFRPTSHSGDREVLTAGPKVTAKTRDLSRNNPLVAGVRLKRTTAVVGEEIGIKAGVLDLKGQPNKKVNEALEDRFYEWAESAEAGGWCLTKAMQLVENHLLDDGVLLVKGSIIPTAKGNPFRIQLFEKDHLDMSFGIGGIEFDPYGKPLKYRLWKTHPGGYLPGQSSATYGESMEVAGEEISMVAETDRASQRHGISPLASAVYKLYGVDVLEDSELQAAQAGAMFGVIIKSKSPELPLSLGSGPGDVADEEKPKDVNQKKRTYVESGGILELEAGEDAEAFESTRPNANFNSFCKTRERKAVGVTGMSYELGSGDFSESNFAVSKMAQNMQWAVILRRQKIIKDLLTWIYRQWLKYEIALFGVPGISISEYNRNPRKISAVSWQLAGNKGVEPLKEIQAAKEEISVCANSLTDFCAERGRDFRELVKKRKEENDILVENGFQPLAFSLDPVTTGNLKPGNFTTAPPEDAGDMPPNTPMMAAGE